MLRFGKIAIKTRKNCVFSFDIIRKNCVFMLAARIFVLFTVICYNAFGLDAQAKGERKMNLYLKQKVFSWGDKFTVYDENGNDVFHVKGEVFSMGKKLHVYNLGGEEICFIRQKLWSFLSKYDIIRNGEQIAQVVKKLTFVRQAYTISGFDWTVDGDFFAHEYSIKNYEGCTLATVSKKWFTWGDSYEISIANGVNEVNVLAVVLTIDACLAAEQAAATS